MEEIDVALMLRPAETAACTVRTPKGVAGIATNRLGRSIRWCRLRTAAMAWCGRLARAGARWMDTNPSMACDISYVRRRMAHAAWTSMAATSQRASSAVQPVEKSQESCSSYSGDTVSALASAPGSASIPRIPAATIRLRLPLARSSRVRWSSHGLCPRSTYSRWSALGPGIGPAAMRGWSAQPVPRTPGGHPAPWWFLCATGTDSVVADDGDSIQGDGHLQFSVLK